MIKYLSMSEEEIIAERERLTNQYKGFIDKNLQLDMSRGKPGIDQLEISSKVLDMVTSSSSCKTENGVDCRNYGLLDGIPEMKILFSKILDVPAENIFVGGNSSLNLMFDTVFCMMTHGTEEFGSWTKQGNIKFLCPVPGYDRHFSILKYFGIEPITVPMTTMGPNMNVVEELVSKDALIKGIWCVPKYSNPQGITYSDETVRRFANLQPKAKDFRIFWDNAYAVHGLEDEEDRLLNIMNECKKVKTENMVILFCSTSKITFPGSGVAAMAASKSNLAMLNKRYFVQTIGFDKINQLRHVLFFKNYDGILNHMKKHREILKPKFDVVLSKLEKELGGLGIANWDKPRGGYFISLDVLEGCAKKVVKLCKDAGVILTSAGATYPHGIDPLDKNIRLAPTYPPVKELSEAMNVFCTAVRLAALESN